MLLAGMIDVFVGTRETTSKQIKAVGDKRVFLDRVDQCLRTAKKDGRYLELVGK